MQPGLGVLLGLAVGPRSERSCGESNVTGSRVWESRVIPESSYVFSSGILLGPGDHVLLCVTAGFLHVCFLDAFLTTNDGNSGAYEVLPMDHPCRSCLIS